MSWPSGVDPELRETAERVLTAKQLEVVKLVAAGYGMGRIALLLGITRASVKDRAEAARLKIEAEL